jgi:DNA-binding MarR family transcriptional regulator
MYHSGMKEFSQPSDRLPDRTSVSMFAFIQAGRAVEDRLEAALGPVGLSIPKFSVLSLLVKAGEPVTLSELAARMACVRSNVTQLVDRLEADGFVRRISDSTDRRSVLAELTPLGVERHVAGAAEVKRVQEEFSDSVGEFDGVLVNRLLATLV